MIEPFYKNIEDPSDKAMSMGQNAVSYGSKMDRPIKKPRPTAGGAISAGLGGAAAGNAMLPGFGAVGGAVLGIAGYLLS